MSDAAPPAPAPVSRPRRNAFAQWLTHWTFWPAYAAGVFVLLALLRPWEGWGPRDERVDLEGRHAPSAPWVGRLKLHSVHTVADSPAVHALAPGSVIAVLGVEEPGPEWLPCDGRWLTAAEAPALAPLFAAPDDVVPETFTLPDCRGLAHPPFEGKDVESLVLERALPTTSEDMPMRYGGRRLRFWIRARQ